MKSYRSEYGMRRWFNQDFNPKIIWWNIPRAFFFFLIMGKKCTGSFREEIGEASRVSFTQKLWVTLRNIEVSELRNWFVSMLNNTYINSEDKEMPNLLCHLQATWSLKVIWHFWSFVYILLWWRSNEFVFVLCFVQSLVHTTYLEKVYSHFIPFYW